MAVLGPAAAIALSTAIAAAPPERTGQGERTQFVRAPVVVVETAYDRPTFDVSFRVHRRLPEDAKGAYADVSLAGENTDAPLRRFGAPGTSCYTGTVGNDFGNPRLRNARPGQVLPLALRPRGQTRATRTRVRLVAPRAARARLRALDCGSR